MRVLVDVNVVLDVLLDRPPHARASGALWAAIERGRAEGLLAGHAVTIIYYLLRRGQGGARAKRSMEAILRVFGVAAVDEGVVRSAIQMSCGDFEDAVTAGAAEVAGCDFVATRDPRGFRGSPVRALTPEEAVGVLQKL